ncbi:MAG: hypothetical protein KDA61_08200, partial [Planctomycetales bacterium]|nr:hypothetical protein [Planctomycetales bacterium]
VLLLVVLSLLVLFLMIGTAFIVTTKQFDKAAVATSRGASAAGAAFNQDSLLDQVVYQVLRGTSNPHSVLRAHSLLEDMYGLDGFVSVIPPAIPNSAALQQFNVDVELQWLPDYPVTSEGVEYTQGGGTPRAVRPYVDPQVGPITGRQYAVRWPDNGVDTRNEPLFADVTGRQILEFDLVAFRNLQGFPQTAGDRSLTDNAYAGQVLTFTSGPAKGVSTRIVGSFHHGNWITLRVLAFSLADGSLLPADPVLLQQTMGSSKVLVNGRPFNGTGIGYEPGADLTQNRAQLTTYSVVSKAYAPQPLALLPNASMFNPNAVGFTNPAFPDPAIWQAYFGAHAVPSLATQNTYKTTVANDPAFQPPFERPFAGAFGADEAYDAPDYQNMALAMLPTDSETNMLTERVVFDVANSVFPTSLSVNTAGELQYVPLPSYHRPALLNYWENNAPNSLGLALNPLLLRRVMLRPNWFDHPNFTGSNPDVEVALQNWRSYAAPAGGGATALSSLQGDTDVQIVAKTLLGYSVYGPWDVDNDNDGVRDSVWIDFGAPVFTDSKGRKVKPMAAILTVDMDGRVNVNTAGTLDMVNALPRRPMGANNGAPYGWTNDVVGATDLENPVHANAGTQPQRTYGVRMARGEGWGPAEIDLRTIVGGGDARNLLAGTTNFGGIPGRYGDFNVDIRPGVPGYDNLGWLDCNDVADMATGLCSYAAPPDYNARYATGVNALGQPLYEATLAWEIAFRGNSVDAGQLTLRGDNPYEIDLTSTGPKGASPNAADQPYGVAELEGILRLFDADASGLSERLSILAGIKGGDVSDRMRLTTDSNDVPTPSVQMPDFMAKMIQPLGPRPGSVAEMIETRVRYMLRNAEESTPGSRRLAGVELFPLPIGIQGASPLQKDANST